MKDAYNGTGFWFESWPIVRKIKKKKSSQGGRSTKSEYKTQNVGIQNILVVQMVNVEKNHGKDKKKAAKNKTTMARKSTFLSSESSSSSDSDYEDSSSLSSSSDGDRSRRQQQARRRPPARQNNDDPDADLSFGNDMSTTTDGNRMENFGTPRSGGYQQQEEEQTNQGGITMFDMQRIFRGGNGGD